MLGGGGDSDEIRARRGKLREGKAALALGGPAEEGTRTRLTDR